MKKRIVKEWIVYLITGVLYGIVMVRSRRLGELDALLVLASSIMLIITGLKIQHKESEEEKRIAYSRGVNDAWKIQRHVNCQHTIYPYFKDDE